MGLSWSGLWEWSNPLRRYSIVMIGLDGAGKTTILTRLKKNRVSDHTVPTIGFNVETVWVTDNIQMTMYDVGGQDRIRPMWEHYYEGCQAVIFVVDSNDVERLAEAKEELDWVASEEKLRDAVFLVFANKQDISSAAPVVDIAAKLDLPNKMRGRKWFIQGCCATTGDGLWTGVHWLGAHLE